MKLEVTDQMIEDYIEQHKDEYLAIINKKINTAIRNAITDAFREYRFHDEAPETVQLIDNKVNLIINHQIDDFKIDKDSINQKIRKQIDSKLKKLDVDISI